MPLTKDHKFIAWFHLCEMFRIVNSLDMESRLLVSQFWSREEGRTGTGDDCYCLCGFFSGDESVLKLDCGGGYTTLHFKGSFQLYALSRRYVLFFLNKQTYLQTYMQWKSQVPTLTNLLEVLVKCVGIFWCSQ